MADVKTTLRELSVAVTVGLSAQKIDFTLDELYNIKTFFEFAKKL